MLCTGSSTVYRILSENPSDPVPQPGAADESDAIPTSAQMQHFVVLLSSHRTSIEATSGRDCIALPEEQQC